MALAASNGGPAALMASELMARGRESAAALEALLQGTPAQHGDLRELAEQILCCLIGPLARCAARRVRHRRRRRWQEAQDATARSGPGEA
ncbi:hypothetical protein EJB05_36041, partial [Eragrostis curvula]